MHFYSERYLFFYFTLLTFRASALKLNKKKIGDPMRSHLPTDVTRYNELVIEKTPYEPYEQA